VEVEHRSALTRARSGEHWPQRLQRLHLCSALGHLVQPLSHFPHPALCHRLPRVPPLPFAPLLKLCLHLHLRPFRLPRILSTWAILFLLLWLGRAAVLRSGCLH
jgi:hypothetical protein